MKSIYLVLAILISVNRLSAQTHLPPVRLALISETTEAAVAVDILTAKLSGDETIQLLERDQIEKVYQEQSLSAANQDYLKLGRILGADGLLLLNIVRTPQATNLTARLIAVKPGVILADGAFDWPLKDTSQWSESAAAYLNSFLPKLTVLPENAIPLSVVNLRSAVNSTEGTEIERQLKQLIIQRLSQEPQFFVLERQKMQLLGDEKELKADDSAFYSGSYLLEGTVDQNGYSPDKVTIDARLTPPKGGVPILMETSGSRTNLTEVINQLAAHITDALKIKSGVKPWNASDEAEQFYNEARWALGWGAYPEAQAAAESAWALGKHDVSCATLRIRAYMVSPDNGGQAVYYPPIKRPPPQSINSALKALELYMQLSRNMPPDEPKVDSDWYRLGLDNLILASRVLQVFNWSPEYYQPFAENLAELRKASRETASWISHSPSVHDSYFVGDRVVVYDDLHHFEETPSIFSVELDCGCLWQDSPEDTLALYRELMSSAVFRYIHNQLWFRDQSRWAGISFLPPRLIAWNETDQERLPLVWNQFMQELKSSSNPLLPLEVKAICLADATNDMEVTCAFTNFFDAIFQKPDTLVTNHVEVLYLEWGIGDLIEHLGGNMVTPNTESLQHLYYSEYRPKLEGMNQTYRNWAAFEKEKVFLETNKPFDLVEFVESFQLRDYSKSQALEIQPLVVAYQSNLVVQSQIASAMKKAELMAAIGNIGLLKQDIDRIINTPTPPQSPPQIKTPAPVTVARTIAPDSRTTNVTEIVTNVITVSKFLAIPLDGLMRQVGLEKIDNSIVTITLHDFMEGRLVLGFDFNLMDNQNGQVIGSALGMLDPATEHWEVINCPKVDFLSRNRYPHHTTILQGELFNCDDGKIEKYDPQNQIWQVLKVSDGNNYELFAINGHLYAANGNTILEITNDGQSTRILASTRRQPPVSVLDTEMFGPPTMFEGPKHSLRVYTNGKLFSWTGSDWRDNGAAPPVSSRSSLPEILPNGIEVPFGPKIFPDGAVFRDKGHQDTISCLPNEDDAPKLYLKGSPDWTVQSAGPRTPPAQVPKPLCTMPANLPPGSPLALRGSQLYLLENTTTGNEYNGAFLCFSPELPEPQKVCLKFEPAEQKFPDWILPTADMLVCGNSVGVWLIPLAPLDSAISTQKKLQLEQKAQSDLAVKQAHQALLAHLLAQYDLNHNGVIDPDEREAALDDPVFIESQLDVIDANHNGQLDLEELAYFDANQNKILEPKEQAGIEIALHLLAKRDLQTFDADGDGFLNKQEFASLLQAGAIQGFNSTSLFHNADANHDGKIDLNELESFLKQSLRRKLHPRGGRHSALLIQQIQAGPNPPTATQQMFKLEIEAYWRDPASVTNQAPVNHGYPNGAFFPPGSMPRNGTP